MMPGDRSRLVKTRATELGFDAVGISDLSPTPHGDSLREWLASGKAGTMTYLHRQAKKRLDPSRILPGARYAVVVTRNYYRKDPPPAAGHGLVAKYARGPDYHEVLRGPLEALARYLVSLGSPATVARTFVDAGPVPERELAQRAGLGWIGKNTMLIDPERGSFFFLGTVLTDLELEVDRPFEADRCGTCTRCLDACPTQAFSEPRVLDARRCISFLTIESRRPIEPALSQAFQGRVFGCDICQDVCPWNVSFATECDGGEPGLATIELAQFDEMSEAEFQDRYGATPLNRPGLAGMRRNALAIRNQVS